MNNRFSKEVIFHIRRHDQWLPVLMRFLRLRGTRLFASISNRYPRLVKLNPVVRWKILSLLLPVIDRTLTVVTCLFIRVFILKFLTGPY